ncbi:FISUMP domain-containing protein [uncultured Fibrobacter sp.]|uniref:FISUMP domain-containing protein n=1 Tax=uncultured Fibrobacter sp. TaxID=261512 RepID=UPI0025D3C603|nr:FISUMP domain-containing protein [uncultured Fibrobacter sp.]
MFFGSKRLVPLFLLLWLVACGDDESSGGNTGTPVADEKTILGVVQKGPYAKGASVSVHELDAGVLLLTGNHYEGKVLNDSGAYSVTFDEFESPYAILEASGLFRNELTGAKTKSSVTLYAVTDLSERDSVNVNLLTHLEYARVLYLVTVKHVSFSEAKAQAEREVMAAFGIKGDFGLAENLDAFGNGDGSAALLAMSVLVLGCLNTESGPFGLGNPKGDAREESKLSERLSDMVFDIEKDGEWNDKSTIVKIADWAANQSMEGGLDSIRETVASWKMSKKVPAFEKYVDNFWRMAYGFDVCDGKRENEARRNMNPKSAMEGVYFVCQNGKWVSEEYLEDDSDTTDVKDTAQVADTSVVDTAGVADTTVVDTLSDLEKDTQGQRCTYFGRIVHGVVDTNNVYFCDGVKWKLFDGDESARYYKLMDNRDGRIYRYVRIDIQYWMAENLNYGDTAYSWNEAKTACPAGWHLPSKEEWDYLFRSIGSTSQSELDKRGFAARPAGLLGVSYWTSSYDKDSQGRYPYDIFFSNTGTGLSKLHDSTSRFPVRCVLDYETLSACDEENLHRVARYNNMVYYVCEEDGWHMMNYDEYNEFKWTGAVEGKTLWDGSDPRMCYVYDNGAWYERDSSNCKLGLGGCTAARQGELSRSSKSVWYTCDNGTWVGTMDSTVDQIMLGTDFDEGTVVKCPSNGRYCVFQDGHWREGTKMDSVLYSLGGTPCMIEGDTSKVKYAGEYYVCRYVSWRAVHMQWETAPLIYNDTYEDRDECSATGLYGDGSFHNKHDNAAGRVYVCENGGFRLPTEIEMSMNMGCTSYNYGKKIKVNHSHFICTESGWAVDPDVWEEDSFTDPRDGREYRTVGIWDQVWMGENLNYTDSASTPDLKGKRWCYDDEQEQCDTYGSMYSCEISKSVCPAGWHLPTESDWQDLLNFMTRMGVDLDKGLRAKSGWYNYTGHSDNGTDVFGFTALPGGIMYEANSYGNSTREAWFWYVQDCSLNEYEAMYLSSEETNFVSSSVSGGKITDAYSVRCIKDAEE